MMAAMGPSTSVWIPQEWVRWNERQTGGRIEVDGLEEQEKVRVEVEEEVEVRLRVRILFLVCCAGTDRADKAG